VDLDTCHDEHEYDRECGEREESAIAKAIHGPASTSDATVQSSEIPEGAEWREAAIVGTPVA
jgi:hypothetical protein